MKKRRMIKRILLAITAISILLGGFYLTFTIATLPDVRRTLAHGVEPDHSSLILARDGTVIMSYGKYHYQPLPLSKISPSLIDALLSTEDQRFYQHKGVDPIGVLRAVVRNIRSAGLREGGSSITQQLARTIFLSNERSFHRKIREAFLAVKLEQELTKDEILELYLNNVYLGEGAYGIGAASQIYFGKAPSELNKAESALLAGLPQAPSRYNPFVHPELAVKRRDEVLHKMARAGKITEQELWQLQKTPLKLSMEGRSLSDADKAPYFNRVVLQEALAHLQLDEAEFWQQGYKIHTTLDAKAQRLATLKVQDYTTRYGRTGDKQQVALLSLDKQGGMMAYVGGRDFTVSQFDRVTQARRQAGSLFKVFVYAAALQKGIGPQTVYNDVPVKYGKWQPENYDRQHQGYMTMARALVTSNNVIATKILKQVGVEPVIQLAQQMGVESELKPNLSLALGSADVSLRELTAAFSVLSNNGEYIKPYAVQKIEDKQDRTVYQHQPERWQVLPRSTRDTMVRLMQGVIQYGTGRGAAIGIPAGGKTGTSDDYRDAWFIGYTPEVTTGVWVGNDDNSQMRGITGGSLPTAIWHGYMASIDKPKQRFDLAYAMPIQEKDFFEYDLAHLSKTEPFPVWDWFFHRTGRTGERLAEQQKKEQKQAESLNPSAIIPQKWKDSADTMAQDVRKDVQQVEEEAKSTWKSFKDKSKEFWQDAKGWLDF